MKKALILVALLLTVFIGEILFFENNTHTQDEKPYIAVTSFALYDITKYIVDGKVQIKKLVPFGVEMHTYMPSVKTMSEIVKAKIFIFNGLGVEPWIKKEYPNELDMSQFVKLDDTKSEIHEEDTHAQEEHAHEHHGDVDPHYWLDIDNMILMTKAITSSLSENFPQYTSMFDKRAQAYISDLKELDAEYFKTLKVCKHQEIVVNHKAFGYLGNRYGFSSHSVTGLSPDEQASAKKIKEITDLVEEEDIKVIFFESFVSPAIAQTISRETGAKAQSLQPLANVNEDEEKKGFLGLMRENLVKLQAAMECQ